MSTAKKRSRQSDEIPPKAKSYQKAKRLHTKLLYTTISIDYLDSSVEDGTPEKRFRANVKKYLNNPVSDKDVFQLMDILEKNGIVRFGVYDALIDIVSFDMRIVDEIEKTKAALQNLDIELYYGTDADRNKRHVDCNIHRSKYNISRATSSGNIV